MNYSKNDFITFCKMYEETNHFEFNNSKLIETDSGYKYQATFRDEHNYKIPVNLYLTDGEITWDVPKFYEDEKEDTEEFFHELINDTFSEFEWKVMD